MSAQSSLAQHVRIVSLVASAIFLIGTIVAIPATVVASGSPGAQDLYGLTIATSVSSVKLPKPFILSGFYAAEPGVNGALVKVYVRKPGSARWSYSSTRATYGARAASSYWWYRYTPKVRGIYHFYATLDSAESTTTTGTALVTIRTGVIGVKVQ